jgi:hypothetical protein
MVDTYSMISNKCFFLCSHFSGSAREVAASNLEEKGRAESGRKKGWFGTPSEAGGENW